MDSTPPEVSVDLTTELRWFFAGQLPEAVHSWFTHGGAIGLVEHRCDSYRFDGQADIGVKRRFGTVLELKLRQGPPEPIFIGPGVDGWLEIWQRWTPADAQVILNENATWVDVEKTVIKRRLGCTGQELPLSEETRAMTGQGCDVEIATVSLGGRTGWTFAFAAFGLADSQRASLELASEIVLRSAPRQLQLQLRSADSCGYPEWLARSERAHARRRSIEDTVRLQPDIAG
ncbi:MAG: hypothetical protein ACR2QO_25965 [Acidimicrobiales bacterium]